MRLGSDVLISPAITPAAGVSAATLLNGTILDMAGYRAVMVVVTFGAFVGGAVTSIKLQQGAQANMSDAADLLDTGQTVPDTSANGIFVIDLRRPNKRYVRLVVSRATQACAVASANYFQYEGRRFPVTQPSGVAIESFSNPAEGTA